MQEKKTITWKYHKPTTGTTNQHTTKKAERWQLPAKKTQSNPVRKREENRNTRKKQWLQDIKLHNSFNALLEETATDPTESHTTGIPKPPPIYIDAKIIDPLIELVHNTAGKDNYVIKQIKIDQVKLQTNTPDTFIKVTRSLKEKNAEYHTYQLKSDKSYKAVIRELHLMEKHWNLSLDSREYRNVVI